MSYIAPNTEVEILRRVPLDKNYEHTLKQDSLISQYNMLHSFVKYTFTGQSYQRVGRNKIRLEVLADNLYDCNYMIFRNTEFGTKRFYAFITGVEYINNITTEITYEIDVIQTWYFDYDMEMCFIEREHTETDEIGDNLVPENFSVGDLIPVSLNTYLFPNNSQHPSQPMYNCVVFYVPNNEKNYITGISGTDFLLRPCKIPDSNLYDTGLIVNGIYVGCKMYAIPMMVQSDVAREQTRSNIDSLIGEILGSDVGGSIVAISQIPTSLLYGSGTYGVYSDRFQLLMDKRFTNSNSTSYYVPKNNKLFTYPYKQIVVSNNCGQKNEYKWECFETPTWASFHIDGCAIPSPEIMCSPESYRGLTTDYESGLILCDFPAPPWSEDSFAKWWTANKSAFINSMIASAVTAVSGALISSATGNAVTGAMIASRGVSSIHQKIGEYKSARATQDQLAGSMNVSSLRTIQNRIGYYFYDMGVEKDLAESIDNYFTMFGYAINKVKKPNIKGGGTLRPHWNYIKTQDCVIHPASLTGLSADDEKSINAIYNTGITFWNNPAEIGDYSLDNSPIQGG